MTKKHLDEAEHLFQAILKLQTVEECQAFFDDLCTIKEIQDLSQRFDVANMLDEGKNYQEISALTGATTPTISRVKKCLIYGSGGYRTALDRAKGKGEAE